MNKEKSEKVLHAHGITSLNLSQKPGTSSNKQKITVHSKQSTDGNMYRTIKEWYDE